MAGDIVISSDHYRGLIEAYALGSLDPEERTAVAAHLATGCQQCNQALAESRCLVSQLAYLAPESAPSDMLRGRLMKTVRAEAAAAKKQVSIASSGAKSAIPFWIWGAMAAALLFALYNAYEANSLQKTIHEMQDSLNAQIRLQQESAQQLALAKREAVILADPASVKIAMSASNPDSPVLQAAWHQTLGIVVSGQKLPVPSGTRTLQLWLIPKAPRGKPVPSLTLRPDADGNFDLLVAAPPDSQSGTKALAITEEPEGGSPQPTTTPIWVGAVAGK
jgi:anti-sigma-K factor RskA